VTAENQKTRFRLVLKYLEAQLRAVSNTPTDDEFRSDLASVLKYLRALDEKSVQSVLATKKAKSSKVRSGKPSHEISDLKLSEISEMLLRTDVTRAELEGVLIHRFGVPKGSMRSLGSIERLKMEIMSLVENENAHGVIERIGSEPLQRKD